MRILYGLTAISKTVRVFLTLFENNIKLPILRFGYRSGRNIPLYAITEGRPGCTSLNPLFKIILVIRVG